MPVKIFTRSAPAGSPGPIRSWATVISAMLLAAVVGGSLAVAFGVLAASWIKAFDTSYSEVMAAGVAATICAGFCGIIVGKLAARYSARPLLGVGALLGGAVFLLSSIANSIWQIVFLFGLAGGPAIALTGRVIGQFLAIRLFERPGLALGVVSLGLKIGAALVPLATALLLTLVDWRTGMALMGGGMLFLAAPLILFGISEPANPAANAVKKGGAATATGLSTWAILRDPVFIAIALVVLPSVCLSSAVYFNFTLFLVELGGTPALAGSMLAAGSIIGLCACPFFGMLTDRVDHRLMLAALIALNVTAVIMCASMSSIAAMWFVMPTLSLGGAILQPLFPAMLLRRFGKVDFPRVVGVAQPALSSSTLGALFAAFARDNLETYQGAFAATLLFMVPALIGFVVLILALRRPSLAHSSSTEADSSVAPPLQARPT